MVPTNGEWVAGMYHQAFRFGVADATELRVDPNPLFDLQHVTMMSWVRPLHYDAATDRAIIMNKERSCKIVMLSRFVALPVSLTRKVSPLQTSTAWRTAPAPCRRRSSQAAGAGGGTSA